MDIKEVGILSDFELNIRIAELISINTKQEVEFYNEQVLIQKLGNVGKNLKSFLLVDYCNNWNDLMPLVVEHGICYADRQNDGYLGQGRFLVQYAAKQLESGRYEFIEKRGDNLQRALAECLLLVLQNA